MKKALATILAFTLVFAFTACGGDPEANSGDNANSENVTNSGDDANSGDDVKSEGVMTHAEYIAAAVDDPVVIEAYVQAHQSWWDDKVTVYAQDKDGAYFIYNMTCSEEDSKKLVPGTKIKVTGYKTEWSGEVEVAEGATFEIMDGSYIAEATDVTSLLGTDELISHQNEFVSFKGMTVEAYTKDGVAYDVDGEPCAFVYRDDNSGYDDHGDSDLYFNVSSNGQTYTFCVEYYLCNENSDVYKAVQNLKVGDVIDLEGFLYWYNGANPHITSLTVK